MVARTATHAVLMSHFHALVSRDLKMLTSASKIGPLLRRRDKKINGWYYLLNVSQDKKSKGDERRICDQDQGRAQLTPQKSLPTNYSV